MLQDSSSISDSAHPHDFSSSSSSSSPSKTTIEETLKSQRHSQRYSSSGLEVQPLSRHTIEGAPSLTVYLEPASRFRRSFDLLMAPPGLKRRPHIRRKEPPRMLQLISPVNVTNTYEFLESPRLSPSSTICTYSPSEFTHSYNPPFTAPTGQPTPGKTSRPPSYYRDRPLPSPALSHNLHSSAPVPTHTPERTDSLSPYSYDRPLPSPPLPSPPLSYDSPSVSAQGHPPEPFEVEPSEHFHLLPNTSGLSNPPSPVSSQGGLPQETHERDLTLFESHLPSSSRDTSFYLSQMTYVQRIHSLLQYGTPSNLIPTAPYKPQPLPPIQTRFQKSQDTLGSDSIYNTMATPQISPFHSDTVGDIKPDDPHSPPQDQVHLPQRSDSMSIYSTTSSSETGHWDTIGDIKPDDSTPAAFSWGCDTEVFAPENSIMHSPDSWLRPEYEEETRFSFARQNTAVVVELLRERRRRAGMDSILVTDYDGPFTIDDYREDDIYIST